MSVTIIGDAIRREFGPDGVLELLGRGQVARELGTTSSNLYAMRDLPIPVAHLPWPVWLASDIRAFARERRSRCSSG